MIRSSNCSNIIYVYNYCALAVHRILLLLGYRNNCLADIHSTMTSNNLALYDVDTLTCFIILTELRM